MTGVNSTLLLMVYVGIQSAALPFYLLVNLLVHTEVCSFQIFLYYVSGLNSQLHTDCIQEDFYACRSL